VYHKAKELAMNNGEDWHLAAILYRNRRVIKIGTNSSKTHPKFVRVYKNGEEGHQLHAEMSILRFAKPGDKMTVMRFDAKGELTMAKPCKHCESFLREAGIKEVTYSDWSGDYQTMVL
jgi:deoxycytidylate deaminase